MNFQKVMNSIIQSSPKRRTQSIKNLSQQIKDQMLQLEQIQKNKKTKNEQQLFQAFFIVIQKIAKQVQQTKFKYKNINKQKLRQQKCLKIAQQISIFKQQCLYLKSKLIETKKQLQSILTQNDLLQYELKIIQQICQIKSKQKLKIKSKTYNDFFLNKHKIHCDNVGFQSTSLSFQQPSSTPKNLNTSKYFSHSQQRKSFVNQKLSDKCLSFQTTFNKKKYHLKNLGRLQ